jgi:DNA-3-methyladenine glycosylase
MKLIIKKLFFDRPTLVVAREMLGKYIVRRIPAIGDQHAHQIALMITEVEAYDGPHDLASHASRRRYAKDPKTGRASVMFGEAGRFYMFFTYGMHWMANVVIGPKNYPAAILFRAGSYRDAKTGREISVTGPARFAKFLQLDGSFTGKAASRATGLWFEDRGVAIPRSQVVASKRIGVDYAGPVWAEKEYNFHIKTSLNSALNPKLDKLSKRGSI